MGKGNSLKLSHLLPAALLVLAGCLPGFSSGQDSNPNQIKKNIHQSKKDLAAIQKKLDEEKKRKRQDEIKEKKELGRLQAVDQALGKLRREKEANEEDLQETRGRVSQLRSAMTQNQAQLVQNRELLK